jgi:hypothetical protein
MLCAREMRGTASIAKPCTPAARSDATVSGDVSGARKPTSTAPGRRRPISSDVGGATFSTASADHGSPRTAPAAV